MAKFVIECPNCGKFAEAKTGFFARKKIDCACGYTIHVRTDKLASRECPHCGNTVVFDQSKGEHAKVDEFSCAQCGVRLRAAKTASTYICPVCDHVNDVQERLKAEEIKKDGLASIVKYEGDNETLVWKHPVEDFNFGSQLIVHESQEAIFFRDGQALDLFGAGRYTLETQQLPLLEKLYKLPTDIEGTFHSEVYFINMATQMGIKWGTDTKVRMFDPASGLHIELGASGEFNVRVTDSRKLLLKLVGTTGTLKQDQLLGGNGKGFFRAMVMTQVKSYLAQAIRESGISVLEIDERLMDLSEALRDRINPRLAEYGLTLPEFFVSRIVTPDDDPNYRRMKEQYAEQYLLVRQEQIRKSEAEAAAQRKAVEAETEARMKIIGAQGEAEALKIQKQAEAEAYRMQAAAEAEEMRMKGYSYQQETARQVGLGATMAMGMAGANGGGGGLSDLATLGVTLGAMGGVANMTKDALNPVMGASAQIGQAVGGVVSGMAAAGWDCPECGNKGITGKFCSECGAKKPEPKPAADSWDCACGNKGITGKFCTECGAKRPEAPATWDCACGNKGITGKFCSECGAKKPEAPTTWDCSCGNKGITGKFCPECGSKREG